MTIDKLRNRFRCRIIVASAKRQTDRGSQQNLHGETVPHEKDVWGRHARPAPDRNTQTHGIGLMLTIFLHDSFSQRLEKAQKLDGCSFQAAAKLSDPRLQVFAILIAHWTRMEHTHAHTSHNTPPHSRKHRHLKASKRACDILSPNYLFFRRVNVLL